MPRRLPHNLTEIRRDWPVLGMYERFEAFVALVLTLIIAAVILVALWRLIFRVADTLVLQSLNPLEQGVFQAVFGEILTVLIAPSGVLGGGSGAAPGSGCKLLAHARTR